MAKYVVVLRASEQPANDIEIVADTWSVGEVFTHFTRPRGDARPTTATAIRTDTILSITKDES